MIPPIRATATTQALWPSTGRKAKDSQIGSGTLHSPSEAIVSRDHCRGSTSRTEGRAKPPSSILRTQIARARIDANHPENWRNFIDLAARPRLHEVGKRAVSKREILEVSDAQGSEMGAQNATPPQLRPSRPVPARAAQVNLSPSSPRPSGTRSRPTLRIGPRHADRTRSAQAKHHALAGTHFDRSKGAPGI